MGPATARGCNDETNLSTEQACPEAPPRLSRAYGHEGRPPRHQRAPCQGPQAPVSLTSARPARLKKRAEFKAVARGVRVHRPAFTLQACRRVDGIEIPRVGFTVTKKVGNAVVRNRIRRRFRALTDRLADEFSDATDYVIVARREALDAPFATLGDDLTEAIRTADDKLKRPAVRKRA